MPAFREKEIVKKDFVDDWRSAFSKRLGRAENRLVARLKRFYKRNYFQAIDTFIQTNNIQTEGIFKTDDWTNIYISIYTDIGLDFAKWYANNFRRYIPKAFDSEKLEDVFQQAFKLYALEHAGTQIELVKGTALETLKKILQRRLQDPEFNSLGERERARILRSEFTRYSDFQARRLVRTEATAAANFAQAQAAQTIFSPEQMQKEWIASFDDRTRSTHSEADTQVVRANDTFIVGGMPMMFPGDPAGGAAETINCRCSVAYFPIQGAEVVDDIDNIGLGVQSGGLNNL